MSPIGYHGQSFLLVGANLVTQFHQNVVNGPMGPMGIRKTQWMTQWLEHQRHVHHWVSLPLFGHLAAMAEAQRPCHRNVFDGSPEAGSLSWLPAGCLSPVDPHLALWFFQPILTLWLWLQQPQEFPVPPGGFSARSASSAGGKRANLHSDSATHQDASLLPHPSNLN